MSRGLLLAAPASGAGKTVVTLGLLRALRDRGTAVTAAKSGPDYIDPAFHAAASGRPSVNLDAWAMDPGTLRRRALAQAGELLLIEGAMGVLDGARPEGRGSAADLAEILGLPVVLILDIAKSAQSAVLAPLGLRAARPNLEIAGVVLNRAGSQAHGEMAAAAVSAAGFAHLGTLRRLPQLALPERHLGLVQAAEHPELEAFLSAVAAELSNSLDIGALADTAAPVRGDGTGLRLPPLGQRIAVACDTAFAFAYPHLLSDWRAQGAQIHPFSPLADEPPAADCDAVFLPGGYPELWAGRIAAAETCRAGLSRAAERGARIYGECGGYMALGDGLVDADGVRHRMWGLLPLETSFAARGLTLGYRKLTALDGAPWQGQLRGHEFHYARILSEGPMPRLYAAEDASGAPLPALGLRSGNVAGSFAHVIAPSPETA